MIHGVNACCTERACTVQMESQTEPAMSVPFCCGRNSIQGRPTVVEGGYVIGRVCVFVCVSVSRITANVISRFRWNLLIWSGLPVWRIDQALVVIRYTKTDSVSFFHFPQHCRMSVLVYFFYHFSYSKRSLFTKLSELMDVDRRMNQCHSVGLYFGSDPTDPDAGLDKCGFDSRITFDWGYTRWQRYSVSSVVVSSSARMS